MEKKQRKARKRRNYAMTHEQRIFIAKVRHGLAKNTAIKDMKGACDKLGIHIANGRRALLDQSTGEVAKKNKAEILAMAGIKPKDKTKTGEPA